MNTAVILGVGASNGLGAALARQFAAHGLHTVVAGRTVKRLEQVAAEIVAAFWFLHSQPGNAWTFEVDLRP